MKIREDGGPVHEIIIEEAIKLLPETVQEMLEGQPKELIIRGAHDEDTTVGPLGPVMEGQGSEKVSRLYSFLGKVYGKAPFLEHFWDPAEGPGAAGLYGHRNAFQRARAYWKRHAVNEYLGGFRPKGWETLGRACHLLADLCVPAHVHNDPHYRAINIPNDMVPFLLKPLVNPLLNDDDFERHVAELMQWDDRRWTAQPDHRIICNPGWPLVEMFTQVASRTAMYDSDDEAGTGNGRPYRWGTFSRDFSGDLTDYACERIGDEMLPLAFQATAGMIYRFMMETKQPLPAMTFAEVFFDEFKALDVTDDGEGEVKLSLEVNGVKKQLAQDMRSGETWPLDRSVCVEVKDGEPLIVRASAYDDDGWFLDPNDRDEMGLFDNRYWDPDWGSGRGHVGGTPWFDLTYRIKLHKVPERPRGRGFVRLPTMVGRVGRGYAPDRDDTGVPLVFNRRTDYVHKPDCPAGRAIKGRNRLDVCLTEDGLEAGGYRKCSLCLGEA